MAYEPDPRDWQQKHWLYEKYWGEMLGVRDIADEVGMAKSTIDKEFRKHGIPRRTKGYEQGNSVSPFEGFYNSDENAQTDEESRKHFDPDAEEIDKSNLPWQKDARDMDVVGEKAVFGD